MRRLEKQHFFRQLSKRRPAMRYALMCLWCKRKKESEKKPLDLFLEKGKLGQQKIPVSLNLSLKALKRHSFSSLKSTVEVEGYEFLAKIVKETQRNP
ncbi:CLUMA_CG015633, isoform A [Clunio marinus]|uniref:CLUMA_CG015633, isoform A n=1 Tax=Clunio marinus TaxID=568069 RepID=A0A1J1IV04_9DIPT|nr:CLUMA_CG015633, isoform A [Clunio marinus]